MEKTILTYDIFNGQFWRSFNYFVDNCNVSNQSECGRPRKRTTAIIQEIREQIEASPEKSIVGHYRGMQLFIN